MTLLEITIMVSCCGKHTVQNTVFAWLTFALESCIALNCHTSLSPALVDQGEVGISATVIFETLTGEIATTHLELHNEGSTAIYYSWQQLVVPCHFPNLRSQRKTLCFHFNSSSGNKQT